MELNFIFKSSDHIRYENGRHVSGPHGGAGRAVKIEPNINGCEGYDIKSGDGYIVTLFNLDGNHPIWQNNVQMAPKPMRIVSQTNDKIILNSILEKFDLTKGLEEAPGELSAAMGKILSRKKIIVFKNKKYLASSLTIKL